MSLKYEPSSEPLRMFEQVCADWVPMMYAKRYLPDIEQWSLAQLA